LDILTGKQFAPRALVGIIIVVEKGGVNWEDWYAMKLYNEIGVVQKKGNNLVGRALTTIALYYLGGQLTTNWQELKPTLATPNTHRLGRISLQMQA
jgi:hypothetical protein